MWNLDLGCLRGDPAHMPLDYLAANGKSHACSLVFAAPVKALEYLEDSVQIDLFKSNAVIFNGNFMPGGAGGVGHVSEPVQERALRRTTGLVPG